MSADKQKINEDAVSNSLSKATKTGSRRNAAKRAQDDGWGGEGMVWDLTVDLLACLVSASNGCKQKS